MNQVHNDLLNSRGRRGGASLVPRLGMVLILVVGLWISPDAWAVTVSPTAMTFEAVQGATNPPSQTVKVSATTKYSTFLMARDTATWLTVTPEFGSITQAASVALAGNTAGLAAGTYSAMVTITVGVEGSVSFPVTVKVAAAKTVTNTTASLTWNPVTSSKLAGYKVYVGTASGRYGPPLDVGNVTSYVVSNLAVGNTYYFVVTSYNTSGSESLPSTEVSKSIY